MSQKSMPDLNLHLEPSRSVETKQLESLKKDLNILHQKQTQALICILCNVAKYKSSKILFSRRNQANLPEQYNPFKLGNKPIISVVDKLKKAKLVKETKGIPHYLKDSEDNYRDPKKSAFEASPDFVILSQSIINEIKESGRLLAHMEAV